MKKLAVLLLILLPLIPAGSLHACGFMPLSISMERYGSVLQYEASNALGISSWQINDTAWLAGNYYFIEDSASGVITSLNRPGSSSFHSQSLGVRLDTGGLFLQHAFTAGDSLTFEYRAGLAGSSNSASGPLLSQQLSITNFSGGSKTLSLYEFVDFNLGPEPENDTLEISSDSLFVQSNGEYLGRAEYFTRPDHATLGHSDLLLSMLMDGQTDESSETWNTAYILRWDVDIAPGETFSLGSLKSVALHAVPVPSTLLLTFPGIASILVFRRVTS